MSTTPPRQRRRDRVAEAYSPGEMEDDAPGTPGPTRARINNLEGQVQELVRKSHAAERKAVAESKEHEHAVEELHTDRALLRFNLEREALLSSNFKAEVARCREQERIMREEVKLLAKLEERQAALNAIDQQLIFIEMDKLSHAAKAAQIERDYQVQIVHSHDSQYSTDRAEKEARIAALEAELASANTSMAHQRAAEDKALVTSQGEAQIELSALQARVKELERTNRDLKLKEKEVQAELDRVVSQEGGKAGSADRETGELRSQLRLVKKEVREQAQKAEEAKEALDEYKERMDAKYARLKEKARALQVENERLAEVETELAELQASKTVASERPKAKSKKMEASSLSRSPSPPKPKPRSKPVAAPKPQSRKTSPTESDEDVPKKKKKAEPLRESSSDNIKSAVDSDPPSKEAIPADKKKKRRILGGAAPAAFTWDPIMSSGDGVIPTFLSPVRPGGKSVGTVPRAGFGSLGSRGR